MRRSDALNEQLQTALNSRVIIEQAKGKLAERLHLDMDQSFALLRDHARSRNRRLSELAQAGGGRRQNRAGVVECGSQLPARERWLWGCWISPVWLMDESMSILDRACRLGRRSTICMLLRTPAAGTPARMADVPQGPEFFRAAADQPDRGEDDGRARPPGSQTSVGNCRFTGGCLSSQGSDMFSPGGQVRH